MSSVLQKENNDISLLRKCWHLLLSFAVLSTIADMKRWRYKHNLQGVHFRPFVNVQVTVAAGHDSCGLLAHRISRCALKKWRHATHGRLLCSFHAHCEFGGDLCVCVCVYVCVCVCVCMYVCMCMHECMYVCVLLLLLIKHVPLPWVILHAVGIQLGSISGDTVAIITRCRQSLYSLYNFTALVIVWIEYVYSLLQLFEVCMYVCVCVCVCVYACMCECPSYFKPRIVEVILMKFITILCQPLQATPNSCPSMCYSRQ
jgi:hypothetical protein